jgi:hypothetical protein
MKLIKSCVCEICSKHRSQFNHTKCAKIKQEKHQNDKRPQKQKLTKERAEYLLRTIFK